MKKHRSLECSGDIINWNNDSHSCRIFGWLRNDSCWDSTHLSESVTCDPVIPIDTYGEVQTSVFPISDTFDDDSVNQFNFLKEPKDRARKRGIDHGEHFRNKVLNKLKTDMKSSDSKSSAGKCLIESFGDLLDDYNFVYWLAEQLELKPCRLKETIKNAYKEFTPRDSTPTSSLQSIYNFWLGEENSIISNDRRNGRNAARIPKATYLSKYGNFVAPNIEVEDVILKKTNTVKRYDTLKYHVWYTRKVLSCFILNIWKIIPISIVLGVRSSSTDHFKVKCNCRLHFTLEKQSCLCIVCQNAHTKLRGINTFRKPEKLKPIYSVTEYLKSQEADDANHTLHPERPSKKNVNYYVFESVLESYVKNNQDN